MQKYLKIVDLQSVLDKEKITKIEFAEIRDIDPKQVYKCLRRNAHLVDGKVDGVMFTESTGKVNEQNKDK